MPAGTRRIRTIVVDDSPAAVRAIRSVVERQPNLCFAGEASNGRQALVLATTLHPDLALIDLEMPEMDGVEATRWLGRVSPATRVVIVTVHDTPELRRLCHERGARAFVAKHALREELPTVIRELFGDDR